MRHAHPLQYFSRIGFAALFLLSAALQASAQQISLYFGGKIGLPITRSIPSSSTSFGQTTIIQQGLRLTAAPTFTLFVDDRLAVDVEALFRPVRYETDIAGPSVSTFDKTRATALEIPVIASYHFTRRLLRPFVGAGLIAYEK